MDPATKKEWEERATVAKDAYLEQKKRWLEERSIQSGTVVSSSSLLKSILIAINISHQYRLQEARAPGSQGGVGGKGERV